MQTPTTPHVASPALPWPHLLLAVAVIAVWGTNFVVIGVALTRMPPLTFATLRFAFAALPWLLFVRPPRGVWLQMVGYGVVTGCGQFGLLYLAMRHDISPGMASLVIQAQVFFTVGLVALLLRERPTRRQIIAMLLAAAGLGITLLAADVAATPLGLALTLGAAFSWAVSNLLVKSSGRIDALGFIVWTSAIAALSLAALTLLVEGPTAAVAAVEHATLGAWLAVLWQAIGNTLFGYGAWSWLLARYPAAVITPLSLLVPVFGMATSAAVLAEPMPAWKMIAAVLVIGGLCINLQRPRRSATHRPHAASTRIENGRSA
jgi:O-acetylserine/cysteine efflux transporter